MSWSSLLASWWFITLNSQLVPLKENKGLENKNNRFDLDGAVFLLPSVS